MSRAAERLLATAVLHGEDLEPCAFLRHTDFLDPKAGALWEAAWSILDLDQPITLVSLERELKSLEKWDLVGGLEIVKQYDERDPWNPRTRLAAAKAVREASQRRQLAQLGRELAESAESGRDGASDVLAEYLDRLGALAAGRDDEWEPISEVMAVRLDQARQEAQGERERVRIPTGLRALDEYLRGGWRPGWLIGLAATEKQGKTALGAQFGRAASRTGRPTLVVSGEMRAIELAERELAARADVPIEAIDDGPRDTEWRSLMAAAEQARAYVFDVVDRPGTWERIKSVIRRWARRHRGRNCLVMIDYLQLVNVQREKGTSREQELSRVSREAKWLAMELGAVVVLLAQLNDKVIASREDKRPRASDLRESSALNKDANVLLALHRPWVYDTKHRPEVAEIHILRNRHGQWPCRIDTVFAPRITAFGEATP